MTANMSLERNDGWLDEVNMENPASGVTIFAGVTAFVIFKLEGQMGEDCLRHP